MEHALGSEKQKRDDMRMVWRNTCLCVNFMRTKYPSEEANCYCEKFLEGIGNPQRKIQVNSSLMSSLFMNYSPELEENACQSAASYHLVAVVIAQSETNKVQQKIIAYPQY